MNVWCFFIVLNLYPYSIENTILSNRQNFHKLILYLSLIHISLGPVNVDAIAQFEEVKQRLDFLNGQKDDLLEAKSLLLNTICLLYTSSQRKSLWKVCQKCL